MVFGRQSLQGYESNRWYADGVRVENIPRNPNVGPPREDSKSNERPAVWTCAFQRQDHLHVNAQRHWMESKRKPRKMWIQFTDSCDLCSQSPSRSLVFLGAWIRKEMVRKSHLQTRRILGPNGREDDGKFHRIRSSNISSLQCFWEKETYEAK